MWFLLTTLFCAYSDYDTVIMVVNVITLLILIELRDRDLGNVQASKRITSTSSQEEIMESKIAADFDLSLHD